jgi:GPH family glycoside/pentoside/hexuronide:cation symporter
MFSLKFGSAVGGAIPGFMLAWFGFVANQAQNDVAVAGIRLMFNVVPAVYFLAAATLMFWYSIDRHTLQQVERDLHSRRGAITQ